MPNPDYYGHFIMIVICAALVGCFIFAMKASWDLLNCGNKWQCIGDVTLTQETISRYGLFGPIKEDKNIFFWIKGDKRKVTGCSKLMEAKLPLEIQRWMHGGSFPFYGELYESYDD